ncbi:MAG: ABC transporter permease [Gammaproteobacteria bacterium]|jgi:putative ABC transport system permease protein|nr:ABC transporter permease [Gammaproteobacteria bacterium]
MLLKDLFNLSFSAVRARRLRSSLTALGIAVGITAVVLLTSMGEGLHRFMLAEFSQFGTNLIAVTPGKTTTHGVSGAVMSNVRPLTLNDATVLTKLPQVIAVVPVIQGNATVKGGGLQRSTYIFGVGADLPKVWQIDVAAGQFLPDDDPRAALSFIVIGSRFKEVLFSNRIPLGEIVRVGGSRFRVIGVMESKGQLLGFDLDDAVYIPAAKSMELFNRDSLMEIDILYEKNLDAYRVSSIIKEVLLARHGEEDFTIVTQEQMLEVLSSVLDILTFAVGALGGISLLVGGVGILTIMTIAVKERTAEIGLLTALGAERHQILILFLTEAMLLSALGGVTGLLLALSIAELIHFIVPAIPVHTPWHYVLMAEALAIIVGLVAGVMPARQAAGMNPVDALRSE